MNEIFLTGLSELDELLNGGFRTGLTLFMIKNKCFEDECFITTLLNTVREVNNLESVTCAAMNTDNIETLIKEEPNNRKLIWLVLKEKDDLKDKDIYVRQFSRYAIHHNKVCFTVSDKNKTLDSLKKESDVIFEVSTSDHNMYKFTLVKDRHQHISSNNTVKISQDSVLSRFILAATH